MDFHLRLFKGLCFIVAAFLNILGGSILSIAIIFWFNYFNHPFGIMLLSTLSFWLILLILSLILIKFEHWKLSYEEFKLLIKMGILNALGGLFITYSSQPDRLSPVFQQFLISTLIFFSIFCNKWIIDDKKKYMSIYPIASLILIMSSTIIYSATLIIFNNIKEEWYELLIWTFINLAGQFSMALFGVYQTLYVRKKFQNNDYITIGENSEENSEDIPEIKHEESKMDVKEKLSYIIIMLLYTKFIQGFCYVILYPVDFIPHFGVSSTDNFFENFLAIFKCNFSFDCNLSILFYILFVFGYSSYYFSNAYFNVTSAPFSSMFSVLIAPMVIMFWLIFSHLNPDANELPIYIPIISIILNIIGMLIWKLWEHNNEPIKIILEKIPFFKKYSTN